MTFSIIPECSLIGDTLMLTDRYGVSWEYNDFTMPAVYDNPEEVKKLIERYKSIDRDRSNDTMHGAFLGLDAAAIDPVLRARSESLMKQSMDIAKELGLKGVVFHTGLIGGLCLDYYLDNWLGKMEALLRGFAKDYPDLFIYLENSFEKTPDIFLRFFEATKDVPNIKFCLDYAHAILTPTPIEEWVEKLAPFTGHMHLNDNDLKDDLHMVPGTGKIDFAKWKHLMDKYNYASSVLLELRGVEKQERALEFIMAL